MQVPVRKSELSVRRPKQDQYLTQKKYQELEIKLNKLKNITRPQAIEEVQRLALHGDFSENVPYQIAKGRLRGMNQRILELEDLLSHAEIINENQSTDTVKIGHMVTLDTTTERKKFRLLGGQETNPSVGIISINSPLGQAVLGHKIGDVIKVKLTTKTIEYKIINIK